MHFKKLKPNPIIYIFILFLLFNNQIYAQNLSFQRLNKTYISGQNTVMKSYPSELFLPQQKSGYLCRFEWKLEKYANIPFKFRLGSVDKIERLEGKRKDWMHP